MREKVNTGGLRLLTSRRLKTVFAAILSIGTLLGAAACGGSGQAATENGKPRDYHCSGEASIDQEDVEDAMGEGSRERDRNRHQMAGSQL